MTQSGCLHEPSTGTAKGMVLIGHDTLSCSACRRSATVAETVGEEWTMRPVQVYEMRMFRLAARVHLEVFGEEWKP